MTMLHLSLGIGKNARMGLLLLRHRHRACRDVRPITSTTGGNDALPEGKSRRIAPSICTATRSIARIGS
jgi:hypothetical protein